MPLELISRIAARGDGVTPSGRHVALTAPGDMVDADGRVMPGPHHRSPPCRHFPVCGGCQLQHLDDASYAGFVTDRIAGALRAQGLEAEIRPPTVSPPRTRRRTTLHAERRGRAIRIGFTETASHRVIDMVECHVLLPALFALVAPLRGLLAEVMPDRTQSDVHMTMTDQGVDVLIVGRVAEGLPATEALTLFAERHVLARLAVDEGYGAEPRWEPRPVTITLSGPSVAFPAGSFVQATCDGERALIAAVREAVGGADIVADLFAGLGTFALALRGRIYAAEAARDAVLALKAAGGERALVVEHRDLFRRPLVASELDRFGAAVLDPPRAGAREQVLQLAQSRCPRVAYVSCNPSSFARDVGILCEGGYQLEWVQPVGQFTWSTHVELAACLTRQG